MRRLIRIYDTTLRDGTQGGGIALSVADKLRIAERLDAFGVHYIEGGQSLCTGRTRGLGHRGTRAPQR